MWAPSDELKGTNLKPPRPSGRGFCLTAVLRSPERKKDIFV